MEQLIRVTYHLNGCIVKHKRNRSIGVIKNFKGVNMLVMRRCDITEEEKQLPSTHEEVFKDRIHETTLNFSDEAAVALFFALKDYLERVKPEILNED